MIYGKLIANQKLIYSGHCFRQCCWRKLQQRRTNLEHQQRHNILRKEDYKTLFNENNFKTYWLTRPVIFENIICITSHYDNAILVIDRINFTVLQRIDLGKCSNAIPLGNTPQIFEGKLYQLDGDKTLHIFEMI